MSIRHINPTNGENLQLGNEGLMSNESIIYPYINEAYRIVKDDNYTDNFGYQWNKFVGTQVDKENALDVSRVRFFAETLWNKQSLEGQNILEVGSGAGRFSQIVLDYTKGNLYSVDYSNAVEANYKNNGPNNRLHLYQASIYDMPFAKQQFDKVFCLGVLQHTPNVEASVKALIDMVKPGGELVVDFYPIRGWWTKVHAKYIFRPITKKMSHEKLYKKIDKNMDGLIKAYRFLSKIGLGKLNRFLPICDIDGTLPQNMDYTLLREHCVLDTFDMYSPAYDQPQRIKTVVEWFNKNGMTNIFGDYVRYQNCEAPVVRGIKK